VNAILLVSIATSGFFYYPIFFVLIPFFYRISSLTDFWPGYRRLLLFFCLSMVTAYLLFSPVFELYFFKFFIHGWVHPSFVERWEGIERAFHIWLRHPLLGVGVGGMGPYFYYLKYLGESPPDHAWEVSLKDLEQKGPMNVLTEIGASLGIVGLIAFGIWLRSLWKIAFPVLRSTLLSEEEKKRAFSLFFSLIMIFILLQFNQGLFRPYIWVHVALVVGYFTKLSDKNKILCKTSSAESLSMQKL
jgi:hypothetical protein